MYAQLCKRLSEAAPNFENLSSDNCTFRILLLNKCRDEFENRSCATEAFERRDGAEPLTQDEEERRQLAKRKMLGNIKFIGELGKLEILSESILHRCIQQLLRKSWKTTPPTAATAIGGGNGAGGGYGGNPSAAAKDVAENLECLSQIMRTCGRILDSDKGQKLMNQYFERMSVLAESSDLSPRIRFMLRDVIELRRDNWIPRKATNTEGPMPIHQLRDDDPPVRGRGGGGGNNNGGRGGDHGYGGRGDRDRHGVGGGGGGMGSIDRDGLGGGGGPGSGGGSRGGLGGRDGSNTEFFKLKTRGDVLSGLSLNNPPLALLPPQHDKFPFTGNGFPGSGGYRNNSRNNTNGAQTGQGGYFTGGSGVGGGRQGYGSGKGHNNNMNNNNILDNKSGGGGPQGKDIPPRFKTRIMIQGQDLDQVSLRPATNSMGFNKTHTKPPLLNSRRPGLGNTGPGGGGFLNDPPLPPSAPGASNILHKDSAILIKQASLEKMKSGRKDKGPSRDELVRRATSLLNEGIKTNTSIQDMADGYRELKVPDKFTRSVITAWLNAATTNRSENDRDTTADLMAELRQRNLITSTQYLDAFRDLLSEISNKEQQDSPKVLSHSAALAAHAVVHDLTTLADLAEITEHGAHYPLFLLVLQQLYRNKGATSLTELFNQSKVNLLQQLPEPDRTKERLAEILDIRNLAFLFPLARIQTLLWQQIQDDPTPSAFYKWIKENVDSCHYNNHGFINALITVLLQYITQETTLREERDPNIVLQDKAMLEKEKTLLDKYKSVLQAFLHEHLELQVVAVYTLQVFCYSLDFPKGMLLRWFVNLYNLEIIEEEAFLKWKEDLTDAYPGKGKALFQVNSWLTWLAEAESEEEEEEDGDN